ncbi:MAG: helix-turn-helix domain-containing protein [Segetibacter sp.]|jgi:excisionase family DNA binding protein|nr:helix-turn-helix domain-containing protein [Segetibacter sp.]
METLTFEKLPEAVSKLQEKLNDIEQLLLAASNHPAETEELLTISQAAKFLNLSNPTIYGKVSRKEIPVNKQGKRLYFYKSELAEWIKAGRKKTVMEIRQEADQFINTRRRSNHH